MINKLLIAISLATMVGACTKSQSTPPTKTEVVKDAWGTMSVDQKLKDIKTRAKAKYKTLDEESKLLYFTDPVDRWTKELADKRKFAKEEVVPFVKEITTKLDRLNIELKEGV